jgi:hypothetical protein
MRSLSPLAFGLLLLATPAFAQFSAYYEGTQIVDGKEHPVTTRYSVEPGRAVAVFHGLQDYRMIYLEKDGLLRIVDDTQKSYVDLDRKSLDQLGGGAFAQAQAEMAKMPAEQREMMEKMMGNAMAKQATPVTYVWTKDHQTVKGYDCTHVDIMRGDVKRAEYWGTTSPDFKFDEREKQTMMGMGRSLNSMSIMAQTGGPGGETRPFQWDSSTDGYPLISRCFDGDVKTLDLQLSHFDRKPLDDELFKTAGYKKQDMSGMEGGKGKHHRG